MLIIFRTWERPDLFFNEITHDLKDYISNGEVYFDLLMNNGIKDRFYSAQFINGELKINSFKKITPSKEYKKISDSYFAQNLDLIEKSNVLSNFQKSFYKVKVLT